jgi:ribonucleoside-diphosphate reductase alpha chain
MDGIIKDDLRNKVWSEKYKAPSDNSPEDTFKRVSQAIMGLDYHKYLEDMKDLKFLPGGRILAGAGVDGNLTLANCYVVPLKDDSIEAIFDCAKEAAETYKTGGGVGIDISSLRPYGAPVNNAAKISSGSVSFMSIYDKVTEIIGGKHRRGALILAEHINHPDILDFIRVKDDEKKTSITNANISVKLTDEFMVAVEEERDWHLWYPEKYDPKGHYPEFIKDVENIQYCYDYPEYTYYRVNGDYRKRVIYKTVKAKDLWDEIIKRAWNSAEPGILFWDTMKDDNSTEFDNPINNVNPCGEITLPSYGACCLGSINVARFVHNKFETPVFDFEDFARVIRNGVEFLDKVLDRTKHALPEQNKQMQDYRRIGLGLMGIGHCLAYMKLKYDSTEGIEFVEKLGEVLEAESYKSSFELAKTKGAYSKFVPEHISGHLERVINKGILEYDEVLEHGIRNCAVNTMAPSGSISILADCSSGIEPIFQLEYERHSDSLSTSSFKILDRAWKEYQELTGSSKQPDFFVTAHEIDPVRKIELQAKLQKSIDNSISVTTNLPKDVSIEEVDKIYKKSWELGCKGCTIYREGSRSAVLGSSTSSSLLRESHEILSGKTIMIPLKDKVYITVNYHPITDNPMEVFISSAKSGSDKKAINEGYGRLISLFLQQGGKIEDVITTLLDIKGENIEFANGWTVQSLPDAIAKGLLKCIEGIEINIKCPECGGKVIMTSGCMECRTCGFSRCG